MLLILDLDDTIFETQSMSPEIFAPVFSLVKDYYESNHSPEMASAVLEDLWKIPFDAIVKKYTVPSSLQDQFLEALENLEFELKIKTFSDYPELVKLGIPKILVTTGFRNLQEAKIEALGIRSHFEEIHIDDPFQKVRKDKSRIFKNLLTVRNIAPDSVWVIGDNPNSEIIAGKDLGMNTIQRLKRAGQSSSPLADFAIHSFQELSLILKA